MSGRSGVALLAAACLAFACGGSSSQQQPPPHTQQNFGPPDSGQPDSGQPDAGKPDAGQPDAGHPDSGTPDSGTPDSGTPDGGTDGGTRPTGYNLPSQPGWQFYGVQNGGPVHVYGASMDEGGNLWVAGGEEGLFLMTPDEQAKGSSAQFKHFTMDDGLHPYGTMPGGGLPYTRLADGGTTPGPFYLKVLSVAGGKAGTVFVGYDGMPAPKGDLDCEGEWDREDSAGNRIGDPAVYKSGDADRVELQADGTLKVVHYDIFSGPNMVSSELAGRERLCHIYRIKYDKAHDNVWFGANHGFAWGNPEYPGVTAMPSNLDCLGANYGNYQNGCSGVYEHAHPSFGCWPDGNTSEKEATCTDLYLGIDWDSSGRLWVGGLQRSMTWPIGNHGADFWNYEDTQFRTGFPYAIDIWADAAPQDTVPSQWVNDYITGVAATSSGAYFASGANGIAYIDLNGNISFIGGELDKHLQSAASDPGTGGIWFGGYGGISLLEDGHFRNYSTSYFNGDLLGGPVVDIQGQTTATGRKMIVSFRHGDSPWPDGPGPDAVGVFSGSDLP